MTCVSAIESGNRRLWPTLASTPIAFVITSFCALFVWLALNRKSSTWHGGKHCRHHGENWPRNLQRYQSRICRSLVSMFCCTENSSGLALPSSGTARLRREPSPGGRSRNLEEGLAFRIPL